MADVSAGPDQPSAALGDPGIATLWVRAESEAIALARGKLILTDRRYDAVGTLRCYLEELLDDPLESSSADERAAERREHTVLAGYDAIKEQALSQGDGLHEVWLGAIDQQRSREQMR